MSSLKQKAITLFLLLLVYVWFFTTHLPINQQLNLSPVQENISLFVQPEAGRAPIIDAIKEAKHEILVGVYILSDAEIVESLCKARQRGLAVNVMLEEHPFGGGNYNTKTRENLKSCDVAVNWSNPSFPLSHEKIAVIDSKKVFILNQNLTNSSFGRNREYNILDENIDDAQEIRKIFINDWQRKKISITNPHFIISPQNSRAALTHLINSSKKSLDITMEIVNDPQIIDLLSKKAKFIPVRILIPETGQIKENLRAATKLSSGGVMVKTLKYPYLHAKLIVSDEEVAYVGSVNFSSQSLGKNREVGILISEQNNIGKLDSYFENDWSKATEFQ